ncbi:hypothetical protein F4810DRAFT_684473, partial [Camillea tinctor]
MTYVIMIWPVFVIVYAAFLVGPSRYCVRVYWVKVHPSYSGSRLGFHTLTDTIQYAYNNNKPTSPKKWLKTGVVSLNRNMS